ncbi:MAG TPA: amino acid adenylation domain-containing protein [Pyrinomonadaceae bacterium]|nr:amino acid adenylation domain-containing protein [Pyrinomonadaceae bacterium]
MPQPVVENRNLESETFTDAATLQPCAHFRGARMDHFTERPFPRLFEDQVSRAPEKPAVIYENERLTFAELNARANQLARYLRNRGAGAESLIGICVERSLDMAVGILGILKSGAAYLPLDPDYPKERLAFMLDDARPALVVTNADLEKGLGRKFHRQDHSPLPLGEGLGERACDAASPHPNPPPRGEGNQTRAVLLDQDWPAISENPDTNLTEGPAPGDLAYVIYTSGSTGQPKGVEVTHGNLANYLLALDHELQITRDDLYLHTASIAFSSSRRQLMLPLSQGATVVITTSEERKDPLALFKMIRHRGVTVMDAVPSFWRNCTSVLASLDGETRSRLLNNKLRLMLSASEPLWSDIPRTWLSEFRHPAQHVHMFGQTETAGIVALFRIPTDLNGETRIIPVGKPIANSEIFILDEERRPCPNGVAGELYIGGAGVGRGYLNRAELTSAKFIAHPFSDEPGARLYRTGDWAKLNADRQIEFVGRRDQQVKLRGFRVELGEIETALAGHPAIRECVVVARDESNGSSLTNRGPQTGSPSGVVDREGVIAPPAEKRLIAYFVGEGAPPTVSDLRAFLSARLPDYLVPSVFVMLDALPLSANGKVNRLALPDPAQARPQLSGEYLAPRNEIEKRLATIWREVLRVERVGINDNFFELGGHSLLAAQVIARMRSELAIEIPLRLLFDCPTVALLVGSLESVDRQNDDALPRLIEPVARDGTVPLSFAQQQFWLLDQAGPNSSVYNVRTALRISGALDIQELQRVLETIVARHEVLRTNVVMKQGSPVQVIVPSMPLALGVSNLASASPADREAEIDRMLAAEAEEPFDLSRGPLLRTKLLKLSEAEHVLLITVHHIICDGWSVGVLLREIAALYQSAAGDRSVALPQLPIQYADFALWQRSWLQGPTLARQLDYWKQKLADAPTALDLPADYSRPVTRNCNGAQLSVSLSDALSNSIRMLSQGENATLFMTLLAAFQALLFRYSKQEDIVVGSPIAGRTMLETENLIGAFVNTLVFRGDASGNPTFREFLVRTRETVLGAFSHQDLPFEKLVEELNPERKIDRSPLFQVMFAMQNTPAPDLAVEGLALTPLKLESVTSKFDLSLEVEEETDRLRVSFEYDSDLFAPATIERMLGHFQNLLAAVVADPTQRIADLSLLSESERQKLLVEWNDTGAEFSNDACIHKLFEAQVARTPEAIAAEFQGEQLTYRELNARANRLARYLKKLGVGPEILVGVCVERSLEMLVSILAVLKAGGAYVPLDPTYPRERIAFMIGDAGLTLLLTQDRLVKDIPTCGAQMIRVDADGEIIAQESEQNPAIEITPQNLAYIIYTSGSTGNPKGVEVEHRSLVNFVEAAVAAYEINPGDRVLQFASLCFDLSAEEIYPPLIRGATVVLRTDDMISSPPDFLKQCDAWRVTVLDLPTAYWHELTDALDREGVTLPTSVRLVIIGGEKALLERVRIWQRLAGESVRLVNSYGPTETTVVATMCDLGRQDTNGLRQNVSIGRPILNTTVFVLDELRRPVPIGVPGELYIGGAGVARGYHNRPELTAEKFIPDPFSKDGNARLYRTGDLVRYGTDGNIEFLGRVDNQIKIRGFRVELEEIEQTLRSHPCVSDSVVVLHEDDSGDKRLVAYVVPTHESQPTATELRNFLKAKLPSYMLPAALETIAALPLMPNGKIDRRALPEPRQVRPEAGESFVAPRTLMEALLASAWCDALKLDRVGVHDNFFELGGHSLLAARVVSNLRHTMKIELGMVDVLRSPTIAELAALLEERVPREEQESDLALLVQEVADLSEVEAQQRLAAELAQNEIEYAHYAAV